MSIIKRKAGSEDIVKSVLEFDEVPTEGSPNLLDSGAVAQAIGNLGQPLKWKGPATVAQLNAGITGIQPGWTYTLTDAGTLTDGSVKVDVGDEVAWTEDDEWFKLGGDQLVKTEAIAPEFSEEGSYAVGDLVTHDGKLYSSLDIQSAVVWDDSNWSETSVAEQLGNVESKIGSVKNGGALTDAASIDVPNNALSTLATAQAALTLNVNVGVNEVPNFAVEVTPSADCTLTVTKTVGNTNTTLNPSAAGGNSLTTGKLYQLTCVGSCWTLAEFTVPTP